MNINERSLEAYNALTAIRCLIVSMCHQGLMGTEDFAACLEAEKAAVATFEASVLVTSEMDLFLSMGERDLTRDTVIN